MKKISILILLFVNNVAMSQVDNNAPILDSACECLEEIDVAMERTLRYEEIKSCISSAILQSQLQQTLLKSLEKAQDSLSKTNSEDLVDSINLPGEKFVVVVDQDYEIIEERLLNECDAMHILMMNDSDEATNSISDNSEAITHYNRGQDYYRNEQYEAAISAYKEAVDADENFAFAWDMLGLSYRRAGNFKDAISSYKKSLKIEPSGRVPLMNIPIAYEYLKKYKKAITAYKEFSKFFPDDPEGYYGIGRIYHLQGDYANALDNTMKAFIMYNEIQSPYARDAERNLAIFYSELKSKDQLKLFTDMAKKYDIKID